MLHSPLLRAEERKDCSEKCEEFWGPSLERDSLTQSSKYLSSGAGMMKHFVIVFEDSACVFFKCVHD